MIFPALGTVTALLSLNLLHTSAQSVTLCGITQSLPSQTVISPHSISFSAGGTNANGGTTYVEVIAQSSLVDIEPSTTLTLISVPTTFTETLVADASGWRGSVLLFPGSEEAQETCGFGADGRGTCVYSFVGPAETGATISGSVVPVYTLAAPAASSSHSSTVLCSALTPWNVLSVVVITLLYSL
ncbi:hypothetical protein B0H13DRAFT_2327467 [Mycena leptocephala]|nr:hypothetical protein B0H13DRAFT_2327467 [Mycena leptocephala]